MEICTLGSMEEKLQWKERVNGIYCNNWYYRLSLYKLDSSDSDLIRWRIFLNILVNFIMYRSSECFEQTGDYLFFKEDDVVSLVKKHIKN